VSAGHCLGKMISAMDKTSRRTMVEVLEGLHRKVRKSALLNDLKIYVLVNGIVGVCWG
jgi:hypothetical protein